MSKTIAEERIRILFEQAAKKFYEENNLSDRYVELARTIGMGYNVPVPSELRRKFCSECYSFLIPGENCTVRIMSKDKTINYQCEECGNVDRYGY